MSAIINNDLRIASANVFEKHIADASTYIFIGKNTAWSDDQNPPIPNETVLNNVTYLDDITALKRVQSTFTAAVCKRIDWTSGTVYDYYDDTVNQLDDVNPATGQPYVHYTLTDEFHVYKCIDNNYGSPSTVKPTGTSSLTYTTADGYSWRYIYSLRAGDVFNFLTPDWMPIYNPVFDDGTTQWLVKQNTIPGSLDHIHVTAPGTLYSASPTVTINGDGTGATATATVVEGEIVSITMTATGQDYTWATATITDGTGFGAVAQCIPSPLYGHGSDAKAELGGTYFMIKTELDGTELGVFPVDEDYRQVGLIEAPLSNVLGVSLVLKNVSGEFETDEVITGDTSGATGNLRYYDKLTDTAYIEMISGTFTQTETLTSTNSAETAYIELVYPNKYIPLTTITANLSSYRARTGKLLYVSNRAPITRAATQKEELRVVLSF